MKNSILFVQLPIPQLNYRKITGNVPIAAGYLYQTISRLKNTEINILKESESTYLSDAGLISKILSFKPTIICFTIYCWNIHRTIYIHDKLKETIQFKSIAGGPEVTKDNYQLLEHTFNHLIFGEGELPFCALIQQLTQNDIYQFDLKKDLKSPYLLNLLEPEISNTVFIETQRGCPYKCGFCFYNKNRDTIIQFPEENVLETIEYALDHSSINQVYLMDPSLNSRINLKEFLQKISILNMDHKLEFYSEIRAEFITNEWASLFKNAGFNEFEVGLQSTNKLALDIMDRPTDLQKFLSGCASLQMFDIIPKVDLIVGLPGDSPMMFKKSVDFIYNNNLDQSIQVFPLSILPGTNYRKKSSFYQIDYQFDPPYYVQRTPEFSWEDIFNSFRFAEKELEFDLFPKPYLDLSFCNEISDHDLPYSKLYFNREIDINTINILSNQLTHPYQLYFAENFQNVIFIKKIVGCFTKNNPFTPFEIIFFEPKLHNIYDLISSVSELSKKSFLSNDYEYASSDKKEKSFVISIISTSKIRKNISYSQRHIFHWKSEYLPSDEDILKLSHLDGIFIDKKSNISDIIKWQDDIFNKINNKSIKFDDFPLENYFSFSLKEAQDHWFELFFKNEFCLKIQHNIFNS